MKTLTKALIVLACLLSVNTAMATTLEKEGIENEKAKLINKIRNTVLSVNFVDCMKCGVQEQIVLRCTVNEDEEVVVNKIIGVNEDLKRGILKRMKMKGFKASSSLCGQELALHIKFKKCER